MNRWNLTPLGTRIFLEAKKRQGSVIRWERTGKETRELLVDGNPKTVAFPIGSEGLVQTVTEIATGQVWRLKCFGLPDEDRQRRCQILIRKALATMEKTRGDSLAGAPVDFLTNLGGETRFGVVMKNVGGEAWKEWKQRIASQQDAVHVPDLRTRLIWCYGLATAVSKLERHGFIHADLSEGNIMLHGARSPKGDMALVDFDAYACPSAGITKSAMNGTDGYAAPEIASTEALSIGSDRVALAVLIQEILLTGHPAVPHAEWTGFPYDQERELLERQGRAREPLRGHFPELAGLVDRTLAANHPHDRPEPKIWLNLLRLEHDRLLSRKEKDPTGGALGGQTSLYDGPRILEISDDGSHAVVASEEIKNHRVSLLPVVGMPCTIWYNESGIYVNTSVARRLRLHHRALWTPLQVGAVGPLEPPVLLFDIAERKRVTVTLDPKCR